MLEKLQNRKFWAIFLLFATGFVLGGIVFRFAVPPAIITDGITPNRTGAPQGVNFDPLWRAWQIIEEHHVNRGEINPQKMVEGAIKGLVQSLDDPYSAFLNPEEEREFQESIDGNFDGIGVEIGIRDGILTVVAPLAETPAARAGLRAGDKILEIDEVSTENMSISEAVSRIRGERGTNVSLTIGRRDRQEPKEFKIMRALIKIPSVTLEYPEREIALLKVHNFHSRVMSEFRDATRKLAQNNTRNIILDLRNNPGGFFEHAIEMSGWFLPRNSVVVKTDEGNGPEICNSCRVSGNALFTDPRYQIVILVNEGSASAAEILAGALRDNRGITIIGAQTFGKGSVQEIIRMQNAGALKVTIARWLTPGGTSISENGITPDIIIANPEPEEGAQEPEDLQLKRAIEFIKAK